MIQTITMIIHWHTNTQKHAHAGSQEVYDAQDKWEHTKSR